MRSANPKEKVLAQITFFLSIPIECSNFYINQKAFENECKFMLKFLYRTGPWLSPLMLIQ